MSTAGHFFIVGDGAPGDIHLPGDIKIAPPITALNFLPPVTLFWRIKLFVMLTVPWRGWQLLRLRHSRHQQWHSRAIVGDELLMMLIVPQTRWR
jgi:hypothetical protein